MLAKNKIKFIRSLDSKKHRENAGLFVVEGDKMVSEIINSGFKISYLVATEEWYVSNKQLNLPRAYEKDVVNEDELAKVSFLKSPQNVLCVVEIPRYQLQLSQLSAKLSLILDKVQDPGNLGTIIRIADWFGIEHIICSSDTADLYNPKVVQSTMGAITRVQLHYVCLDEILTEIQKMDQPVFGATLHGENIYSCSLPNHGFIMMGNESKGVNPAYQRFFTNELFIPYFPEDQKRSESLNVAIATAIICSEFRRRI